MIFRVHSGPQTAGEEFQFHHPVGSDATQNAEGTDTKLPSDRTIELPALQQEFFLKPLFLAPSVSFGQP